MSEAHIFFKGNGVFSGKPYAQGNFSLFSPHDLLDILSNSTAVFDVLGVEVEWHFTEGTEIHWEGTKVLLGTVRGKCCDILRAERTVLNILSRACGVATQVTKQTSLFCCCCLFKIHS